VNKKNKKDGWRTSEMQTLRDDICFQKD